MNKIVSPLKHFYAATALIIATASLAQPAPPMAPQREWRDSIHGYVRHDEYRWLRDRDDPAVLEYLKAEKAHAESAMAHTKKLREKLYRELRGRIQEDDLSVPVKLDSFYYYERTVKGGDYSIYCRKKGSLKAGEEVLIDENLLASGRAYYSVDGTYPSPDHSILAYLADTLGSFLYTAYFKDLASGRLIDSIGEVRGMVWANDNSTVFFEACDSAQRSDRIIRHRLGSARAEDSAIFREADPEFSVNIYRTKSKAYLVIHSASKTTTEAWVCPADSPDAGFRVFRERSAGTEYYLDHHGDSLYLVSNDRHRNFRMLSAPARSWAPDEWNEVLPGRDGVLIEDVRMFQDYYVVQEREGGLARLRVKSWDGSVDRHIAFPEPTYAVYPWRSYDYKSQSLRYTYTSLVTPSAVYDYDMAKGSCRLMKQHRVRGGYRASRYASERIYAKAYDGELVPVSLVYRSDLRSPGGNPCLLEGYGAYGNSSDPYFSSARLSLLDRGFICAIAHVRGGQEMGRRWYDDGRLLKKVNTFYDFIACAERLIDESYTRPELMAVKGGSAGGLLVGAVVNMRPGLFRAAVLNVPFVDLINTMLDPAIPLTTIEYQEWGDPRDKEQYEYMASYAPYENIGAQDYPAMLVTGGLNDSNVPYWEPAKWVARLRRLKTDSNPLLLKIDLSSGHGGPSGRFSYLRDMAFEYAFLMDAMGIKK